MRAGLCLLYTLSALALSFAVHSTSTDGQVLARARNEILLYTKTLLSPPALCRACARRVSQLKR